MSTGCSGPAFHTGGYFHAINGLWPGQMGMLTQEGCSQGEPVLA